MANELLGEIIEWSFWEVPLNGFSMIQRMLAIWSLVPLPFKGFGIVSKAEIDVFLELCCFSHDPADVGNLVSGSSAFSKTSLNIWFTVHVLLKPGLER